MFVKNEEGIAREAKEKQSREDLQRTQQPRRQVIEGEAKAVADRQRQARHELELHQKDERAVLRHGHLHESQRIRIERAANKPKGLAAFLGRISGVELITNAIHRYRDAARIREFLARKKPHGPTVRRTRKMRGKKMGRMAMIRPPAVGATRSLAPTVEIGQ